MTYDRKWRIDVDVEDYTRWVKCGPAGMRVQVCQRVKCGGEVRGTARILPTCSLIAKEIFVLAKFNEILHHCVALTMSSCLLKDVLWCMRNTQEYPLQTCLGLCRLQRLAIITDSESTCIARGVSTRASIATQWQFDVAHTSSCGRLLNCSR